ncbi:MAG: phage tail tape measure protein [Rhodobacteraceae bacterium]|nr:phage tail tape measure protein [Paracoccaceae bacterium]
MAIIDELVTILGLKGDSGNEAEAGKIKKALGGIRKTALSAGAAMAAAAVAVDLWTKSLAATIDSSGKFADSIGVSFENLQELEFAITQTGGAVSEFRGDLEKLTSSMASPIPGEFNKELFLLGISTRDATGKLKTADRVLVDLSRKFKDFSAVKAQQFGQRLGLSRSTIQLLQRGEEGLIALRKRSRELGGILPEESKRTAAEFNEALRRVQFTLKGIAQTAGVAVLPALTEANDALLQFLLTNRDLISSGLETFVRGIVQGVGDFSTLVQRAAGYAADLLAPFEGITGELDATQAIATAVVAALSGAALVAAVIAAKFIAIGLAVAAVVLVIDDLVTAFQGGDSVAGRMFDTFEKRFPALADAARAVGKVFAFMFDNLVENVKFLAIALPELLGALLNAGEATAGFFGFGGGATAATPGTPPPLSTPVNPAIWQGAQGGNVGDTTVNITVSGAGDPHMVAVEIQRKLDGSRNRAQSISPGLNAPVAQ